jgi:hypothetical protein
MPDERSERERRRADRERVGSYKRSARELWKFCNLSRAGFVARLIEERGADGDWWAAVEPRRRR